MTRVRCVSATWHGTPQSCQEEDRWVTSTRDRLGRTWEGCPRHEAAEQATRRPRPLRHMCPHLRQSNEDGCAGHEARHLGMAQKVGDPACTCAQELAIVLATGRAAAFKSAEEVDGAGMSGSHKALRGCKLRDTNWVQPVNTQAA